VPAAWPSITDRHPSCIHTTLTGHKP